jgi:hypothetical protein
MSNTEASIDEPKYIELTQGYRALVDAADYEEINKYKWSCIVYRGYQPYATTTIYLNKNKSLHIRMHRMIMNPPTNMEVDHINQDTLDNRRQNLRICNHQQNSCNTKVPRARTKPGKVYKGINQRASGRWQAKVYSKGVQYNVGDYDTPEEAALAYNEAAKIHHGEYALLNEVPDER